MNKEAQLQLRDEFHKETGMNWENSDGEPDIDYVAWLEAKVISSNAMLAITSNSKENKKESEVAVAFANIKKLIIEYQKEELPNADVAFHHEAEIASGLTYFLGWLKKKNNKSN